MTFPFPMFVPARALVSTLVDRTSGSAIGNMTAGGGLAAAFDGNTSQTAAAGALRSPSTSGFNNFVGKDWGAGNTKIIARFKVYGSSNAAVLGAGGGSTIKLQGSTDNFSSSVVDLYTSGTVLTGSGQTVDVTSGITTSTAYRYHRIAINGNGANDAQFAELEWYELL